MSSCPSCGSPNADAARFCGECGTRLPGASAGRPSAERRHLTVLFSDLVGSTALSTVLDPEELREVIGEFQTACADVIRRHDGHIAQYLGDGILVYFGYPLAHEDDPRRATMAGLEILDAVAAVGARIGREKGVPLEVRVGVHTGDVVVGELGVAGSRESLAVGPAPNVAARVQSLAQAGELLITADTQRLVAPFFACEDLGEQPLRGVDLPMHVFRVLGPSKVRTRIEAAGLAGMTPLVGRAEEGRIFLDLWACAERGQGRALLVRGEPGIGKSRQVQAFRQMLEGRNHRVVEARCSPYLLNSSFAPIVEVIQRGLGVLPEDGPRPAWRKLTEAMSGAGLRDGEAHALMGAFLGLPSGELFRLPDLSPAKARERTVEVLLEWLFRSTLDAPLLFIVEDLHWADPSTVELMGLILARLPEHPVLLMALYRPEFEPPWGSAPHVTVRELRRLGPVETASIALHVAGGRALPEAVVRQIVERTEGVPLFVEELTRNLLETGLLRRVNSHFELAGPLKGAGIPATLQDLLVARLDRMGSARVVAQIGAVLGREFRQDVLAAVSGLGEQALADALDKLAGAGLLHREGGAGPLTFVFSHALVRDAAYETMLRATRHQHHKAAAAVLLERFHEQAEAQPELVAHHYSEAGLAAEATQQWLKAGQTAIRRSANLEAIRHLQRGLALIPDLPDSSERAGLELMLQLFLAVPILATRGYAVPEVEAAYRRARELCDRTGRSAQMGPVLYGLWAYYITQADYRSSYEMAGQLLALGEALDDDELLLEGHTIQGYNHFYGWLDLEAARRELTAAWEMYDPEKHRHHTLLYGQDPGVVSGVNLSLVLHLQGYPDQAWRTLEEVLGVARALGSSFNLGMANAWGATLGALRHDVPATLETGGEGLRICTEGGYPLWLAVSTFGLAWAMTRGGQGEEALPRMRGAMDLWDAIGAAASKPYQLGLLAEMHLLMGNREGGLEATRSGLELAARTGEVWYEAELERLRGELLLLDGADEEGAEAALLRGLEVARRQRALPWELRVSVSLARLRARQERGEEGRALVRAAYERFSEGFDAPDLVEARALLAQG